MQQLSSGERSAPRGASLSFVSLLMFKPGRPPLCGRRRRRAFTLVELLLVIVLAGILLGVSMPSLVASIRAHRLRSAARSLVTVARYTRSMALLKQSDLTLFFNLDSGQIDVLSSNASLPRFTRVIDGVRLESVTIADGPPITEGVCQVPYRRNGVCKPFAVQVRDRYGEGILVRVDALSSVKTVESRR